jgi:hypothetical protein
MKRFTQRTELEDAIWAGDVDTLCRLAPCECCCGDHTFEQCAARVWGGCRGQGSMTRADEESWARHYREHHGIDLLGRGEA